MTAPAQTRSSRLDEQLLSALGSLVILSPNEYTFAGQRMSVAAQSHEHAVGPASPPQQAMVGALQVALYGAVYNRHFANRLMPPSPGRFTDMTDELSHANPGRERWDHGWQVYQTLANGLVQAHKHGKSQMFYPGQYMPIGAAPGAPSAVQNGAMVSVYLAKEMRSFQEGFYIVLGENVQPWYEQTTLVRVYWHLEPDAAVPIVRDLVARFNRFQVPFRFKCLAYRELYDRFDAGVLFVGRRRWDITAILMQELYENLRARMRPEVPLFTKRLAPGLAVAEDPGTGESFGTSRCRLVAEGVWDAYQRGLQTGPARLEAIAGAFARAGISLDRPWLSEGSIDLYDVRLD